ncbi:hypothetical protein [Shewanella woodyi]|uniref:hypothetical protein n=1 Tax=Shewanella woodyi TaxID=60961 RepID=UPI0002D9B256|nr:hypothetical protein [Shewanella woodyi]
MQKNVWNIFCPMGSTTSNNFPVKRPAQYPYLALKEFHRVKLRPEVEARSRTS